MTAKTEPTHAEYARTIVASARTGALSTIAHRPEGHPFGSVATYALDDRGRPILALSTLAEHTRNVRRDPRASLMVAEPGDDPLAVGRVTLLGTVRPLEGGERAAARDRFLAVHPEAAQWIDFGDVGLSVLEVSDVRYVGGFGRMSWVTGAEYAAAEADPIAPMLHDVAAHVNGDHPDALVAYARAYGGFEDPSEPRVTAVDRYGFEVTVRSAGGEHAFRVPFASPVRNAGELRVEMVRLAEEARARQGTNGG